jgi:cell division septum initiation protein DivIVA
MEAVVALTELESYIGRVVDALKCEQNENKDLAKQVSDLKTEVGRLEALLADKKPESECEGDCECCKCREEADEECEPTLKDLYALGKYLVDTVDEIESIHIQVVRTRKKEDDDEE